jgi:phosphatidate cytidylyltransferase
MMVLLALVGWYEYSQMVSKLKANLADRTGAVWLVALFSAYWFGSTKLMLFFSALMMAWLLLRTVVFHSKVKPVDSAYTLYGLIYIGAGFLAMLALRNGILASFFTGSFATVMLEPARFFVFLLVFSTWASDTFAFAAGKLKGKVKLCPAISPGKTREGALGGFIGTIVTALIFSLVFKYAVIDAIAIGIIIGIMAPLGDLVESVLKRTCQIKDSGNIIPGHGGVLDRFDSLLFAGPALYLFLLLLA